MAHQPVVSETTLPDGSAVVGAAGLKKYLLEHRRPQFAKALTAKLLAYSLGRTLELTDKKTVAELTAKFVESDYRIGDLIQLVVASDPFHSK
jgi:hypothetical protein